MPKGYDAPAELRPLEKRLREFTYQNGMEISRVFQDWLRFIIGNFTLNPEPDPSWRYAKEQNLFFHQMMCEWFQIMNRQVGKLGWYDALGELYMSLIASSSHAQFTGQFFTPMNMSDMMSLMLNAGNKIGELINDPTCGSGRLLLAGHAHSPGNYLVGEDLELTCCLMTVCNFIIHGGVGVVIWHNSLNPASYNGGWLVNESLNHGLPIPHVRKVNQGEAYAWIDYVRPQKIEACAEKENISPEYSEGAVKTVQAQIGTQLELF